MPATVQTRAQRLLVTAHDCVDEVRGRPEGVQKVYGTIVRDFGAVVRTTGLAQAVAFAESKKAKPGAGSQPKDREVAYELLLRHLATALDLTEGGVVEAIRVADAVTYLRYTEQVLQAWVYFRRFVVSLLRIDDAPDEEGA